MYRSCCQQCFFTAQRRRLLLHEYLSLCFGSYAEPEYDFPGFIDREFHHLFSAAACHRIHMLDCDTYKEDPRNRSSLISLQIIQKSLYTDTDRGDQLSGNARVQLQKDTCLYSVAAGQ